MDFQTEKHFRTLQDKFPQVARDAIPIQAGGYGLVCAYPGNVIRKFALPHGPLNNDKDVIRTFEREVEITKILSGTAVRDFIPEIISDFERYDPSTGFLGSYRMTCIEGLKIDWYDSADNRDEKKRYFESFGRLIAKFHRAGREVKDKIPDVLDRESTAYGNRVFFDHTMPPNIQEALEK